MNLLTSVTEIKQQIIEQFEKHADELYNGTGNRINRFRKQALDDFNRLGIPTAKNENYRYTPVDRFLQGSYDLDLKANPFRIEPEDVFKCNIPELDTDVLLFLNGFYYGSGRPLNVPDGVVICSLNEASERHPDIFQAHYSKYASTSEDGLVAMNTLFARDGIFIYLPDDAVLRRPLQIINLSHSFNNLRITRRNLVVAGKNTAASLVICDHTLCEQSYHINSLTEIVLDDHSHIDYTRIQNENNLSAQINNVFVNQQSGSLFNSHIITLHAGLSRNNFYVNLMAPFCESNLYGLFLCDRKQHVANYTLMNHDSPDCLSNQLFKGILDDEATGTFNGKIHVRKDAQKTRAYQRNNNILLSSASKMNSKPHLEIYADDVKCSHGATTGQLDNEALFYARTRGISEKEARHLLMYAFANEIVSEISVDILRERIIEMIDKRLRGELSRCNNCDIHCTS
ncbi:MAG: Fe-S cluster assembly protein SufD [Bacteroidales bacterium]|nr:Fe-S cluster assembly protein SufD [Bacteroidales bacterium]